MRTLVVSSRVPGLLLLAVVVLLDQWSKSALLKAAQAGAVPQEIFPFFNLVTVRNFGISFGFLARSPHWMPLALTIFTSLVALMLFIWLITARERSMGIALGFIVGGAVGNIIDRARLGAVTDFLDFHLGAYHWPAFNLADSAIFIGVVILVLISIVGRAREKENEK